MTRGGATSRDDVYPANSTTGTQMLYGMPGVVDTEAVTKIQNTARWFQVRITELYAHMHTVDRIFCEIKLLRCREKKVYSLCMSLRTL